MVWEGAQSICESVSIICKKELVANIKKKKLDWSSSHMAKSTIWCTRLATWNPTLKIGAWKRKNNIEKTRSSNQKPPISNLN